MTAEMMSRIQFALTISFHYIYPPISMGLGMLLVIIGIIYVRTKDPKWRELSVFWIKIYGLVFAMGIATGIVQEFQFGMNWANYSRFVGNVFGSLLAAEGIFAFFLEGGFLGLMLFGGSRLGPRMWLLATALVVFGAHFSATWIVMANSWMQTPAGYSVQQTANGPMAYMTDFFSVMFTPSFIPRIFHVWISAWMVGASLVLSVSAWYLLKKRHVETATAAIKVALPFFAVLSVLQVAVSGSAMALVVTNYQPIKLAAMEGAWPVSQTCAPLYLFGWVDQAAQTTYGIAIPCLLSFLAYSNINAAVTGLEAYPSNLWPPLQLTFQAYHLMIDTGMLFILISLIGVVYYFWGRRVFRTPWLLWVFVVSIVLTELATLSGWWTAEFGRQPWIVYNLLQTNDAGSPILSVSQVVASVGIFIGMYVILFSLFIYLLNEKIHHGPEPLDGAAPAAPLPDTFREIFGRHQRASGR
ncbi:MAG: cytochrome ubiquinol oxidase subunit I [Anaerolineae bacterium]